MSLLREDFLSEGRSSSEEGGAATLWVAITSGLQLPCSLFRDKDRPGISLLLVRARGMWSEEEEEEGDVPRPDDDVSESQSKSKKLNLIGRRSQFV